MINFDWWQGRLCPGWSAARIKDIAVLTNGYPFDSSRFSADKGFPLIRIRDLIRGYTETCFDGPVPPEAVVERGDLLIGMDGDFNVARWEGAIAALNQRICRLRAVPSFLDQRFLSYVIPGPLKYINDLTYATTVKHLSSLDVLNARVPLPSLEEQRAIADFLDAETARIDALAMSKRALASRLLEYRASTTLAGVSGALTGESPRQPSQLPWLSEQPCRWGTPKLSLVANLGSGHTPSRARPDWWVNCTIPWVTTGEVADLRNDRSEYIYTTRESISEVGVANSSAVVHPAGTVVLSRTASAGYSGIMAVDMATSQDFVTWTCGPLLQPRFLLLCLRAMRQDLLGRLAQGSTHQTIYIPDIESIRLPLPSPSEQRIIVDETWRRLRRIDSILDGISRQLGVISERRHALITAAVTGELPIPGVAA